MLSVVEIKETVEMRSDKICGVLEHMLMFNSISSIRAIVRTVFNRCLKY